MANMKRSKKQLSSEQLKQLKAQAEQVDREEAETIKARGRAVFQQHERLRAILRTLVEERNRQGLSLAALADQTGIAKPNLSRLENNDEATPSLDTLERYARALGKTLQIELTDAA